MQTITPVEIPSSWAQCSLYVRIEKKVASSFNHPPCDGIERRKEVVVISRDGLVADEIGLLAQVEAVRRW